MPDNFKTSDSTRIEVKQAVGARRDNDNKSWRAKKNRITHPLQASTSAALSEELHD